MCEGIAASKYHAGNKTPATTTKVELTWSESLQNSSQNEFWSTKAPTTETHDGKGRSKHILVSTTSPYIPFFLEKVGQFFAQYSIAWHFTPKMVGIRRLHPNHGHCCSTFQHLMAALSIDPVSLRYKRDKWTRPKDMLNAPLFTCLLLTSLFRLVT